VTIDSLLFRRVLGHFATGVTILTTRAPDGSIHGMTANAITSVSLDPPLVLACVDRRGRTHGYIAESRIFALSMLGEDQHPLSERFARRSPADGELWAEVPYRTAVTGAPILAEAIAYVDCRLFATYPGGDHSIFVGEVLDLGVLTGRPPLIFFRGRYERLAEGRSGAPHLREAPVAWDDPGR